MFCPKCGSKALDGATFCQKCGANLIVDDAVQHSATSTPIQQMQQQTHTVPSDMPKKKKLGKLPIILGAVALAIIVIIVITMNWNGKIDYAGTVRAHQPFAATQGLSYTYDEVLGKYISSPDWKVRKSGDVNYVDVSGKAKGTDNELVVTIKVTEDPSDPDLAKIAPESVTIDGKKSPTQNDAVEFLLAMFLMYEDGYDDISDLFSETGIPSGTKTMVGETKTYGNNFGNMEVTLDYVEFTDRTENTLLGGYIFPDEGSIFLRAAFTLKNIGTEKGSLITAWNTVVYDGEYEFSDSFVEGNLTDINPLSAPTTGSIIFTVPNDVAESDKPLVININDGSGEAVISYVIRSAAGVPGESESDITYFVELSESYSEGYEPAIMLYQDGRFSFLANMGEGVGFYNGTYGVNGDIYTFSVTETEFSGNKTSFEFGFSMRLNDNTLIYESEDMLGLTMKGSVFSLSDTPPKSIIDASNYEETYEGKVPSGGLMSEKENEAVSSTKISARDFVGTYSYDASFETPEGQNTDFYYLLEIGEEGEDLVVTETWRGNDILDHVRVSPENLTGNTLVVKTNIEVYDKEAYSLTYIPAKDSPLGKDTIYIDDDDTMPFVRE